MSMQQPPHYVGIEMVCSASADTLWTLKACKQTQHVSLTSPIDCEPLSKILIC